MHPRLAHFLNVAFPIAILAVIAALWLTSCQTAQIGPAQYAQNQHPTPTPSK